MGTMLAQKKPLESIQRSQAINFVAEIFYDELQFILDRRLLDHTMVNCHGMNSRVKSRDVLSVSVQHIATTNADKEYILLNLARNSIYHQLPELLFHPLVLSTPGMSNKEIVEAIRANEKQDKELIQFFAPFDTEFFKEKVRINNRHLNFFSDPDSKKNFIKMIEVMENVELSITSHQKYKLFLFLCNAERYKENLPAIEQLLLIVLGLKVKLRLEVHEINETVYLSVGSGCVGQTLGLNGLMISETDDLTATIILDTPTDDYEEVKTHLSNVRRILEFFILSTRNIEVDYLVHGETDFILGENRLGYNMKILLYFFARYLLAPLFVAVMIFVLTGIKTIKSKLSLKKLIIFILLASIAVSLPSLFGFLKNEYVWGGLTFTILSYILLGALFCKLSTSDLFGAIGIGSSRTAVILTLTTICALGGWCYYLLFELISKLPYSLWNTTNILWFAIPYLIMYSRTLFLDIPHPIYTPWELSYGTFDRKYWDNIDNFGFRTVKVKIKRNIKDPTYASLVVRLPNEISLGNWFNWVIEDQNRRFPQNKIETEKEDMQIGWMFYTSKWFNFPLFIRILDPTLTSEGNKIKNNQTIYIRRVQVETKTS